MRTIPSTVPLASESIDDSASVETSPGARVVFSALVLSGVVGVIGGAAGPSGSVGGSG